MRHNIEFTDKYEIRKARFKFDDYLLLVGVLVYFYFIINRGITGFIFVVFLGFIIYSIYRIVKRLQDGKVKIVIDNVGIRLCESNELIDWQKIKYAYIKQKTEGSGKSSRIVDYFHIDIFDGEIRVEMSDFSYKKDILIKAVEHFSGRNIGELTDLLNDKAKEIIGVEKDVDRISKIFIDFYKRQTNLLLFQLITLLGVSVYLQMIIDFSYVFAIGFVLTMGIMQLIETLEEKRLRSQKYISELDEEKFKALKKEYGKEFDVEMNKGKKTAMLIFLFVVTVGIFVFSYMVDNDLF